MSGRSRSTRFNSTGAGRGQKTQQNSHFGGAPLGGPDPEREPGARQGNIRDDPTQKFQIAVPAIHISFR
ncbi:hypothetical protein FTUN_6731 [Frigoriglobus tundricola]|uniref:Uncharacterized protein n=1 Tax=Frigoriglobus tundricola TaxID=2774151 RepID=A0A6M5Z145_9BACT|nr:hypothetical protein FTUN_6731 [Frigoriglobus tundricola]